MAITREELYRLNKEVLMGISAVYWSILLIKKGE